MAGRIFYALAQLADNRLAKSRELAVVRAGEQNLRQYRTDQTQQHVPLSPDPPTCCV